MQSIFADSVEADLDSCRASLITRRLLSVNGSSASTIDGENGFALMAGAPRKFPVTLRSQAVFRFFYAVAIIAAIAISAILAAVWLWLLKNHTRKMVWGTIGITVVLQLGLALMLIAVGNSSAIFLLIMVAVYCVIIYCISM